MATHDYVIDNGTGSAVRADLNLLFKAILTNNSGTTDPSTVISSDAGSKAFSFWADTNSSPAVLKIRNAADDGWIELFQLDGTLTLEDGSASTPALAFRDDLNTGIFSSAADTFNVATGGVERMELGTTTVFNEDGADVDFRIEGDTEANLFFVDAGNERIGIHTGTPSDLVHILDNGADATIRLESTNSGGDSRIKMIANSSGKSEIMLGDNDDSDVGLILYNHGNNNLSFNTGASERFRIDDVGRFLIGFTSARNNFFSVASTEHEPILQLEGSNQNRLLSITSSGNVDGGILILARQNGSTGANTVVSSGNVLGRIDYQGSGGTNMESAAQISCEVDGTPGDNDMPARLLFKTTADGSTSPTERMRIDSSGNVGIGMTPSGMRLDVQSGANDIARFGGINSANLTVRNDTSNEIQLHTSSSDALIFGTNNENERMRITSSGQVLVNTSSVHPVAGGNNPQFQVSGTNFATSLITQLRFANDSAGATLILAHSRNATQNSHTILQNGDEYGKIRFYGSDGVDFNNYGAEISAVVDGSPGADDMPGRLVFKTTSDNNATASERMRLDSNGRLLIQETTTADVNANLTVAVGGASLAGIVTHSGTTANRHALACCNDNGHIGGITTSGSATSFNQSSDYRLKENATAISDGITRLKTLKPYRFNWKVDSSTTVDGFFAHEVTAVPEAITGTKDEVVTQAMIDSGDYEEGTLNNPIYQQIDQSKLVPLLVAAVKELIGKVEALEAA